MASRWWKRILGRWLSAKPLLHRRIGVLPSPQYLLDKIALIWIAYPIAVFTRIYGACEWEAPARQGKLRRIPYICSGTTLSAENSAPPPDQRHLSRRCPSLPPMGSAGL